MCEFLRSWKVDFFIFIQAQIASHSRETIKRTQGKDVCRLAGTRNTVVWYTTCLIFVFTETMHFVPYTLVRQVIDGEVITQDTAMFPHTKH